MDKGEKSKSKCKPDTPSSEVTHTKMPIIDSARASRDSTHAENLERRKKK